MKKTIIIVAGALSFAAGAITNETEIALPPCGMLLGNGVYNYQGVTHYCYGGEFMMWATQKSSPLELVKRTVDENQGNFIQFWFGGKNSPKPQWRANYLAMEDLGYVYGAPDWEKMKNLDAKEFPELDRYAEERAGAGLLKAIRECEKYGLYSQCIYLRDINGKYARELAKNPHYVGYDYGEIFSMTYETADATNAAPRLDRIADDLVAKISRHIAEKRAAGWGAISCTSGCFYMDYEAVAGCDFTLFEDVTSDLNVMSSLSRGLARQYGKKLWGSHLANEYYTWTDKKAPSFRYQLYHEMAMKMMAGAKIVVNEAGAWHKQTSEGTPRRPGRLSTPLPTPGEVAPLARELIASGQAEAMSEDGAWSKNYRRQLSDFYDYVKKFGVPEGQPEVTYAIAKGNYDLSGGLFLSGRFTPNAVVGGVHNYAEKHPEWLNGAPEFGWNLANDVFLPQMQDVLDTPERNRLYAGTPYGQIDYVSFANDQPTADFLLRNYRTIAFMGWNTCSEKQYRTLCDYVRGGGRLVISIPHLSTDVTRNYMAYTTNDLVRCGDFTELCGVKVLGRGNYFYWANSPLGAKTPWGTDKRYGAYRGLTGKLEIENAFAETVLHDNESYDPLVLRLPNGDGEVWFINSWFYPGAYHDNYAGSDGYDRTGFVGDVLKYTAKLSRGRVYVTEKGTDEPGDECRRVNFSYFPSDGTVFLLNLDFNRERTVDLHLWGETKTVTLKPHELWRGRTVPAAKAPVWSAKTTAKGVEVKVSLDSPLVGTDREPDDNVEIFLQPAPFDRGREQWYYQFFGNVRTRSVVPYWWTKNADYQRFIDWNVDYRPVKGVGYELTVTIPWKSLRKTAPLDGGNWRISVARTRGTADVDAEETLISDGALHEPKTWRTVKIEPLDAATRAAAEAEIAASVKDGREVELRHWRKPGEKRPITVPMPKTYEDGEEQWLERVNVKAHLKRIDDMIAAGRPPRTFLVGDSITGCISAPEHMKRLEKFDAVNLGRGGDWIENLHWRVNEGMFDRVKPDYLVMLIGTNNGTWTAGTTAEERAAGVAAVLKRIRELSPKTKILLYAMFPRGKKWAKKDNVMREANALYEKLCDGRNVIFVDIGWKFLEKDGETVRQNYFSDGLHPNRMGCRAWIDSIVENLELLETRRSVLELPPGPGNIRNSEGDFLRLKDGRILFCYSKFLKPTSRHWDDHQCVIAARWSADEGETWTKEDRIVATNTVDAKGNVMSVSLLRLNEKRIALFYAQKETDAEGRSYNRKFVRFSEDEGETWPETVEVTKDFPKSHRVLNNARIVRLKSGRVLMPVADHGLTERSKFNTSADIGCFYSDDGCLTWKQGASFATYKDGKRLVTQEPGVVELKDGRVMTYFRTNEGRQWCAYSKDGAETWSEPEPTPFYSPLSPMTIVRLRDGRLMAVWNDHEGRPDLAKAGGEWACGVRTPLTIAFSSDEGRTWKNRKNVETGYDASDYLRYWYCYPAVMELEDSYLLSYCAERGLSHSRIVKLPKYPPSRR